MCEQRSKIVRSIYSAVDGPGQWELDIRLDAGLSAFVVSTCKRWDETEQVSEHKQLIIPLDKWKAFKQLVMNQ